MEAAQLQDARASVCGNIVGVDPHKQTLSACVLDQRGGVLARQHFAVSDRGHRDLEKWALAFGPVARWGIENTGGTGRHTADFLCRRAHDVRDVCPSRTNERSRRRRQGKSDALDAERIARETLADPRLPRAFKRADEGTGPDDIRELLGLWHKERRSIVKARQQLLNEAETLLCELPDELRASLPATSKVRPRLAAMGRRQNRRWDAPTMLRLRLLDERAAALTELDARERAATAELRQLVKATRSSLGELRGLGTCTVAELLVEAGDPRRFTQGGFARFNGTAPLPASSGEGDGEPTRYRLNRGGNRRINSILHIMAVTQLRCDPQARHLYENSRARGHTKREAMRVLKRHLSNVVYRQMMNDVSRAGWVERVKPVAA